MANNPTQDGTTFRQDVDRLGQGMSTLKNDAKNVAHDAAEAARSGAGELRRGAQNAIDGAKSTLESAKDMAVEKFVEAKDAVCNAEQYVERTISRNPIASVAIAAGVGLIVGLLVFRRRV